MSGGRRVVFALSAMALSTLLTAAMLLAADLYAHRRAERTAGLNIWGYRGPVVGAKAPGEVRIAFLGGSTLFGYGVAWQEAVPAVVERQLTALLGGTPKVSAVNLGYNNEGAYSFAFTLADYAFLDYDVAVLYEGYNDMIGDSRQPNTAVFRHDSAVFRLTGYFPILPLVLREKAMAIQSGGNLDAAYDEMRGGKTVFTPSLVDRTSAAALEAAARVTTSLGQQLGRFSDAPPGRIQPTEGGCASPWGEYCESVSVAVRHARAGGVRVVVVGQPRSTALPERHAAQQAALADMLARRFAADPGVMYVDLADAVPLSDPELCYDGMHLTPAGNERLGAALARAIAPVVRAAGGGR